MTKKQVDMYVLIEENLKDRSDNTAWKDETVFFGPFETRAKAADFANRRIEMLASEWIAEEDGILTECISWKIDYLTQVS